MIYLDVTLEEFFKDNPTFKKHVQKTCFEKGFPFANVKPFITKKCIGVAIDPKGLITCHRPHDQKFWNGQFQPQATR